MSAHLTAYTRSGGSRVVPRRFASVDGAVHEQQPGGVEQDPDASFDAGRGLGDHRVEGPKSCSIVANKAQRGGWVAPASVTNPISSTNRTTMETRAFKELYSLSAMETDTALGIRQSARYYEARLRQIRTPKVAFGSSRLAWSVRDQVVEAR